MKSSFADQYGWTNQMVCVVPIPSRRPPPAQSRAAPSRPPLLQPTWSSRHSMA